MKEFKIESQASLILEVIKALKYNTSGIGLRTIYDIKMSLDDRNAFLNRMVAEKKIVIRMGPNARMIMLPKN